LQFYFSAVNATKADKNGTSGYKNGYQYQATNDRLFSLGGNAQAPISLAMNWGRRACSIMRPISENTLNAALRRLG
jgi:hypothetical protein